MIEKTLARRYAAAMLSVAEREGAVEDIERHLLALKEAYQKEAAFRRAMGQPRLPRAVRKKLLRKPFDGRVHPAFLDFLDLLVDKHRLHLIPDIAESFDHLADASQGIVRVAVRSTFPLSDSQRRTLLDLLVKITGRKVSLEETVDRSLQGGLSVRIGDSVIDGTVAHRMKELREHLLERRG
ncbi:MAG: ATP synthase F1 subunit delta [Planctomycetes bacterium]|nr:ATP synthase F1 subunit delta [Planctomycetota bacterium]